MPLIMFVSSSFNTYVNLPKKNYHPNQPFHQQAKESNPWDLKGLNLYTISNDENLVVECTLRLYANSINGKEASQFFKFF
jgi:hypothetical protein